jgi:hypothetical protein
MKQVRVDVTTAPYQDAVRLSVPRSNSQEAHGQLMVAVTRSIHPSYKQTIQFRLT